MWTHNCGTFPSGNLAGFYFTGCQLLTGFEEGICVVEGGGECPDYPLKMPTSHRLWLVWRVLSPPDQGWNLLQRFSNNRTRHPGGGAECVQRAEIWKKSKKTSVTTRLKTLFSKTIPLLFFVIDLACNTMYKVNTVFDSRSQAVVCRLAESATTDSWDCARAGPRAEQQCHQPSWLISCLYCVHVQR